MNEYTEKIVCPRCLGSGSEPDGAFTLTTARQQPREFNRYRIIKEYGPNSNVMCGCPDAVSPLHFNNDGTEKCLKCHGSGKGPEYLKYEAEKAKEEKANKRQEAINKYLEAYPYLTRQTDNVKSRILATKNIRLELSKAFPGIKFSIKSSCFSGGDDINIDWVDGPTSAEVKKITDRYQEGHFDGMIDMYEFSSDPFCDLFGGAKYVFENRKYDSTGYTAMIKDLCKLNNVEYKTEEWNIQIGQGYNESACHIINAVMQINSVPAGHKITGLERTDCTCGHIENFYKPIIRKE